MYIKTPVPPDLTEQRLYSGGYPRLYLCTVAAVRLLSQVGVLGFIYYLRAWFLLPYSFLMLVYIAGFLVFALHARAFRYKDHQAFVENSEYYPSVDVFIPTCGEETLVVFNSVRHALAMRYKGEFKVYVLDDGDNKELAGFLPTFPGAERLVYLVRPNRGEGKKGGNLRYGFARSEGELIAIFDADFAPAQNFLTETVPYFQQNDLGILQTPQYFRQKDQPTVIGKGAALAQRLFFRFVQIARDGAGSATCAGSNLIYRRAALEPFGGTIPTTFGAEDRHTAWAVQGNGWKIKYIPIPLASGLCPDTINAAYSQSYRWANGSTRQLLSKDYWSKCPLWNKDSKLTFLNWFAFGISAMSFTIESLPILVGTLPLVYLYGFHPELVSIYNSLIFVPLLLWVRLATPIMVRSEWSWGVLITGAVVCYANLMSVFSVIRGREFKWITTGDRAATSKSQLVTVFRKIYPFLTALQVSLIYGFAFRAIGLGYDWKNFVIGMLIVTMNFVTLIGVLVTEVKQANA